MDSPSFAAEQRNTPDAGQSGSRRHEQTDAPKGRFESRHANAETEQGRRKDQCRKVLGARLGVSGGNQPAKAVAEH